MTSFKIIAVLCITFVASKALPSPGYLSVEITAKLEKLGLGLNATFDYNQYILNLENVIEKSQQVALSAIENTVELAQQLTKALATLGAHQNIQQISDTQRSYFQRFEELRHQAFDQVIDISPCLYPAIHRMYQESQASVTEITVKLENITYIFSNYTSVTYVDPAKENLAKSYEIREKIYQCPFDFDDFTPFYACLTATAVLEGIVLLDEFTSSFNNTVTSVQAVVDEFNTAVTYFRNENAKAFNASAQSVYDDVFVPCVNEHGFKL